MVCYSVKVDASYYALHTSQVQSQLKDDTNAFFTT